MPHGFTWGLVLLKDLPKPPIPVGVGKNPWIPTRPTNPADPLTRP
jgi:hypothetical protein